MGQLFRIGIKIIIAVGLALSRATLAAPPDNPDPALAPWFESLKQPGTGASCCSIADCRTAHRGGPACPGGVSAGPRRLRGVNRRSLEDVDSLLAARPAE